MRLKTLLQYIGEDTPIRLVKHSRIGRFLDIANVEEIINEKAISLGELCQIKELSKVKVINISDTFDNKDIILVIKTKYSSIYLWSLIRDYVQFNEFLNLIKRKKDV